MSELLRPAALPPIGDDLLTVDQAAELLGTSARFPRRLIEQRRIPVVRLGRHVRIPRAALVDLIAAGYAEPVRTAPITPAPNKVSPKSRRSPAERETKVAARRRFGKVKQLPSGRWRADYVGPDGGRRAAPTTFVSKTQAADWLVDIEASILNDTWRDPTLGQEKLEQFLDRWIVERRLRPRTIDLYRWLAAKRIYPTLGALPLNRITPAKVRTWYAELLDDGVSADGAAKAYRLLRSAMNTAAADNAIARNPCQIKGGGIYRTPERPTISIAQSVQLEAAFPRRYAAMVTLATFGSLRYGEVIGLRRSDLDFDSCTVRVHEQINERSNGEMIVGPPKSAAGTRRVVMPRLAMDRLKNHLDEFVATDREALLFTNAAGNPVRRTGFNNAVKWKEAVTALGVPQLHFNDLRHTGNTIAAATPGTSTRDLMERMGHGSMRAALIYQHVNTESARRIADAFDRQLELLDSVPPAFPNEEGTTVLDGESLGASVPVIPGLSLRTKADK